MNKSILIILLILPLMLSAITLSQCLSAAEENYATNPNQEIYRQMLSLNTKSIQSKWYPQFNLSGNYTGKSESTQLDMGGLPFEVTMPMQDKTNYEVALNLAQTLYDGGMISRNLKLANLRTESSILGVRAGLLERKTMVTSLYFQMLLAQRRKEILALHKENLSAELRKVEAGISAGILDKNSSLLMQDQLWQLAEETCKVNYLYQECQQKLSSITTLQFTETDSLEYYNSELIIPAEINRPELEIMNIKKEMELTQTRLAGSGMLPQISASAAYAWGNPGYDIFSEEAHSYYRVGIYLNWQLWDWHSRKHARNLHQKQAETLENNYSVQKQAIELSLIEKDNQIERLQENLIIQSERKALLSQITVSYAHKLEEGIISTEDYLQQFNKHKEIELQQSASELEISFQRILKIFIMGGEL